PSVPVTVSEGGSAVVSGSAPTPAVITAASSSGGTVSAAIPGDAFKTTTGQTTGTFEANILPMSAARAILWTGCTNINPNRLLGGTAYNVYAINTNPEHAGDVAGEAVKPVTLTFTYTDEQINQQGFIEESLLAFGFDPENCNQSVNFVRDPLKKTITVTALPKTFFAVTGELRPGFIEREIQVIEENAPEIVESEIKASDLDGIAAIAQGETVAMCLKPSLFKKPVKRIYLTVAGEQHQFQFDVARDCFALSLTLPEERGEQEMELKIIYVDDQVQIITFTARITSNFEATLLDFILPFLEQIQIANEQIEKTVVENEPVLQTAAAVTVPVVGVASPALVTNAMNWYYYLNHFFSWLFSLLGLRKKRKPWGVVYNSVTKLPVDLVIVRLFEKGTKRLVETQVTDKNGRFSFLAPPGEYSITATKNPLVYPQHLSTAQSTVIFPTSIVRN
ncbi:MAG: carboxypeptidase-like regulatory domain-containing protein, partial [Patescibacteria group bacterium]